MSKNIEFYYPNENNAQPPCYYLVYGECLLRILVVLDKISLHLNVVVEDAPPFQQVSNILDVKGQKSHRELWAFVEYQNILLHQKKELIV